MHSSHSHWAEQSPATEPSPGHGGPRLNYLCSNKVPLPDAILGSERIWHLWALDRMWGRVWWYSQALVLTRAEVHLLLGHANAPIPHPSAAAPAQGSDLWIFCHFLLLFTPATEPPGLHYTSGLSDPSKEDRESLGWGVGNCRASGSAPNPFTAFGL